MENIALVLLTMLVVLTASCLPNLAYLTAGEQAAVISTFILSVLGITILGGFMLVDIF